MAAGGLNGEYPPIKNYDNTMYLSFNSNCKVFSIADLGEKF